VTSQCRLYTVILWLQLQLERWSHDSEMPMLSFGITYLWRYWNTLNLYWLFILRQVADEPLDLLEHPYVERLKCVKPNADNSVECSFLQQIIIPVYQVVAAVCISPAQALRLQTCDLIWSCLTVHCNYSHWFYKLTHRAKVRAHLSTCHSALTEIFLSVGKESV
jgi:hypothetical protein